MSESRRGRCVGPSAALARLARGELSALTHGAHEIGEDLRLGSGRKTTKRGSGRSDGETLRRGPVSRKVALRHDQRRPRAPLRHACAKTGTRGPVAEQEQHGLDHASARQEERQAMPRTQALPSAGAAYFVRARDQIGLRPARRYCPGKTSRARDGHGSARIATRWTTRVRQDRNDRAAFSVQRRLPRIGQRWMVVARSGGAIAALSASEAGSRDRSTDRCGHADRPPQPP